MTAPIRSRPCWAPLITLFALSSLSPAIAGDYSIDIVINPFQSGVRDSWFFDINEVGQAGGYIIPPSTAPAARQAVLYHDDVTQVLGAGTVRRVNGSGAAVLDVASSEPQYVSAGGVVTPIIVPGADDTIGFDTLRGLNDGGDVLVSYYSFSSTPGEFEYSGLFLWNEGVSTPLTVLDPLYQFLNPPVEFDFESGPSFLSSTASATGLNNAKQFAASVDRYGYVPNEPGNYDDDVYTTDYMGAYFYDGQGNYQPLVPRTADEVIRPIDIDNAGTVLGWTGSDLALWGPSGALLSVLPTPTAGLLEYGYGGYASVQRNSLGQIVAITAAQGIVLYDPTSDAWTDITPSINGLPAGSTFDSLQGFNDRGQFVGLVRPPGLGGTFGYVVTPVPEPSAWMLCGIGLLTRVWRKRIHGLSCHQDACVKCEPLVPAVIDGRRARDGRRRSAATPPNAMSHLKRTSAIATAAILAVLLAAPTSNAALFAYSFSGEVTAVSNPLGLFASPAVVGAPVTGSFTYTDVPNQGSFSFNANFTNYSHAETPAVTSLVLSIGGATVTSSEFSLSNIIIGNDNPADTFPPFFPIGDSFRYLDSLDSVSSLFDFSQSELFHYATGMLFVADSTGGAFGSQALPSGLPLASFNNRFGVVDITDDNFGESGSLTFRIDSIQAVPEPAGMMLLCISALTVATRCRKGSINVHLVCGR